MLFLLFRVPQVLYGYFPRNIAQKLVTVFLPTCLNSLQIYPAVRNFISYPSQTGSRLTDILAVAANYCTEYLPFENAVVIQIAR